MLCSAHFLWYKFGICKAKHYSSSFIIIRNMIVSVLYANKLLEYCVATIFLEWWTLKNVCTTNFFVVFVIGPVVQRVIADIYSLKSGIFAKLQSN